MFAVMAACDLDTLPNALMFFGTEDRWVLMLYILHHGIVIGPRNYSESNVRCAIEDKGVE